MFNIAVPTEHGFVTEAQQRIAEIIKDYDPYLELQFIPMAARDVGDKPYRIVHNLPGCTPYIVGYFDECDQRMLEFLWKHDNGRTNVLSDLDAANAAAEAIRMKEQMDLAEERADIAQHMLRTPKNTYSFPGADGKKVVMKQRGGHDR